MNAESTVFRSSRPAVVVAPGGEGVRGAALVLALPLRLAGTPLGRRLLAGVLLAMVLVTTVGFLYDSADAPRAAGSFRPAGLTADASAGGDRRQATASPARPKRAPSAAEVAAAWFAARQKVAVDRVRALQQRRISATEVQVLVVAESGASRMPSRYVTVRKGSSGWRVR